jgi:mannosyltransferase OCH1-like enzyme
MYMHRFGGIYADLDLIPLSRIDVRLDLLLDNGQERRAYVGQMGDDDSFEHSIPNAFMVSSSSGHPFWLRPLEFVKKYWNDTELNAVPEDLTGPVALRNCTKQWLAEEREERPDARANRVQVIENGKVSP